MTLNPNQKRSVAVRLRLLEERLALVRHLMDVDERGALYRRDRAAFNPEQRARMDALLAATEQEIAALARWLGLPCEEQDAGRKIVAALAMSWQNLADLQGPALRGRGEIDPAVSERLDSAVERLLQLVLALEKTAAGSA